MNKILLLLVITATLISGCEKNSVTPEDEIKGTWIRQGTDGTGPAGTLQFSNQNGKYILSFDCSGSPGPDWPSHADTEYKFENNKLLFISYSDTTRGFYTAESFAWINRGKEFEIKLRHLLHFMAADYKVRFVKTP